MHARGGAKGYMSERGGGHDHKRGGRAREGHAPQRDEVEDA